MKRRSTQKVRLTEAQLNSVIRRCINEELEEGCLDGLKGLAKGFWHGANNFVQQTKQNYYQGTLDANNKSISELEKQITNLQSQREKIGEKAAQKAMNNVDQQIAQLQEKVEQLRGENTTTQDKWNTAGEKINKNQSTGYGYGRQYAPQDAQNPQYYQN